MEINTFKIIDCYSLFHAVFDTGPFCAFSEDLALVVDNVTSGVTRKMR